MALIGTPVTHQIVSDEIRINNHGIMERWHEGQWTSVAQYYPKDCGPPHLDGNTQDDNFNK